MAFWTVIGLSLRLHLRPSIAVAPGSSACSSDAPASTHLAGARIWITLWAILITAATALCLHALSPASMKTPFILAAQLVIAIGVSFLLTDLLLFAIRTIPFTHLHKSAITDLPFVVIRYFVAFPLFINIVVHYETLAETSTQHLVKILIFLATAHLLLRKAQTRSLQQSTLYTPPDETDEFPQSLGLRDT